MFMNFGKCEFFGSMSTVNKSKMSPEGVAMDYFMGSIIATQVEMPFQSELVDMILYVVHMPM